MKQARLARRTIGMLVALSALLAACGRTAPSEQPATAPNDVVVTVRVADAEEYRIRLTDADDIATARKLLAGETAPQMSAYGPLVLLAILAVLWFWPGHQGVRESRQRVVLIAVLSVVAALLINQVIIHLWIRPRPYETLQATLLLPPTHEPSFPSDHATFAFAMAFALLFVSAPLGGLGLIVAAVIAFARVYTGQHYVSDVVGGAVIGVLCSALFWSLRSMLEPLLKPALGVARRLRLAECAVAGKRRVPKRGPSFTGI